MDPSSEQGMLFSSQPPSLLFPEADDEDRPSSTTQTIRREPALCEQETLLDIRVPVYEENKGYWEVELANHGMKPSWTFLSSATHKEPMDIIARSRHGEYIVSSSSFTLLIIIPLHLYHFSY